MDTSPPTWELWSAKKRLQVHSGKRVGTKELGVAVNLDVIARLRSENENALFINNRVNTLKNIGSPESCLMTLLNDRQRPVT